MRLAEFTQLFVYCTEMNETRNHLIGFWLLRGCNVKLQMLLLTYDLIALKLFTLFSRVLGNSCTVLQIS